MATTGSRTLQLLSLLQSHRHWPGRELADRLEVSPRTLRRDVERLRELGYPVRATRGVDGGYQLAPGASLPPLVLDDEEAVALAVGLQAAAQTAVAGMAESSVRALAKVLQVMPVRLRRRVDALQAVTVPATWQQPGEVVDPRALTTLAQACRDSERLRFGYRSARDEVSERFVEPHRLVSLGRRWYLVAYDLDRGDWRSFRLDRVSRPAGTGARSAPRTPPGGDAAAFVQAGMRPGQEAHPVEVLVRAPGDVVRAHVGGWGTVEDVDAGTSRLRMTAASLDWPAMTLVSLGADFTVVTPPELVEHLRHWSRVLARATG